jgi:hypothetical protein
MGLWLDSLMGVNNSRFYFFLDAYIFNSLNHQVVQDMPYRIIVLLQ